MTDALSKIREKIKQAQQEANVNDAAKLSPSAKAKRLKRLKDLLRRLECCEDIARRDLKSVLTDQQWEIFEQTNMQMQTDVFSIESRPRELDGYLELLKKADFYYNRAEVTKKTKRSVIDHLGRTGNKRLYDMADIYYEQAIERLNEIFSTVNAATQQQILKHLDRSWQLGDAPNLGPNNMPRVNNSKSKYSDTAASKTKYDIKRENKITAIKDAIASLNA